MENHSQIKVKMIQSRRKKKDNKDSLQIYLLATEKAVKTKRNETYRKQTVR